MIEVFKFGNRSHLISVFICSLKAPGFWIGFFFSCLTLFSLIVNFGSLDISGIPRVLWEHYSNFRDWVFTPFQHILPAEIPPFIKDFVTLYIFMGFTNLRAHGLSIETFDIQEMEPAPGLSLVFLWPVTVRGYVSNMRNGKVFSHPVIDPETKYGHNQENVQINIFIAATKLIPTLIVIQLVIVSLGIVWGSLR